jgi:hypothetical protein
VVDFVGKIELLGLRKPDDDRFSGEFDSAKIAGKLKSVALPFKPINVSIVDLASCVNRGQEDHLIGPEQ